MEKKIKNTEKKETSTKEQRKKRKRRELRQNVKDKARNYSKTGKRQNIQFGHLF